MNSRKEARQIRKSQRSLDAAADEILEFVLNDEEEALSSEHLALVQQRDMPALQEFLREMSEFDSRGTHYRMH